MKIAVLSRNPNLYSTRRLVEAGQLRGHDMVVLDHTRLYTVIEKSSPKVYYEDHLEAFFQHVKILDMENQQI